MKTGRMLAALMVLALGAAACGGGEEPLEPAQARTYFDNIDRLLSKALTQHADGDAEAAAESAGEAYLENFEHLEHDLEEADEALNERLERLLGPNLRREIQGGMTTEELEVRITEIRGLLAEARTALGVG